MDIVDYQGQTSPVPGDLPSGVRPVTPTILVVDDHPETRTLIARILQHQGYDVVTAADGEAAFAAAAVQRPDLVIADVLLPGVNGLTIVDVLRQQDPAPACHRHECGP